MSLLRAHWLPVVRWIVDFSLVDVQCCLVTFREEAVAKGRLLLLVVIWRAPLYARYFTYII